MSQLIVVGRIKAKKEFAHQVYQILLALVKPTLTQDPGCIQYDMHQDNDDPSLFYFIEKWESQALFDKHMNTVHVQSFIKSTEGMIESGDTNILTKVS